MPEADRVVMIGEEQCTSFERDLIKFACGGGGRCLYFLLMSKTRKSSPKANTLRCVGFCVGWGFLFVFATFHARLPLGLLQIAGWTGMYVEYSKTFDTENTFRLILSGEELCGVCETVEMLRVAVNQLPELTTSLDQIQLLPFSKGILKYTSPKETQKAYEVFCDREYCRNETPQAPPPKIATV